MGEHSAPSPNKFMTAVGWAMEHKAKILSVAVVVLPLVSRYVPDFPSDAILSAVRVFLGT